MTRDWAAQTQAEPHPLTQIPDRWHSKNILMRADGTGYSHALISALSARGLEFSVSYPIRQFKDQQRRARGLPKNRHK